jgi:O-antigen ligase
MDNSISQELTSAGFSEHASERGAPLPLLALAFGMVISFLPMLLPGDPARPVRFLGWIAPLLGCGLSATTKLARIKFPLLLWLPWTFWVAVYLYQAEADNSLQRSLMMLTPLVVGAGFSTLRIDQILLNKCRKWLDYFLWLFLAAAGVTTGLLASGHLYFTSDFAAGSITASLLAVWYAARYATRSSWRDLLAWILLASVPVLANTRTGIVAVALTLPMTLAPLPIRKRLIVLALIAVAGLAVFQTGRIQKKMFVSGRGSIENVEKGIANLFYGEKDSSGLATSGRAAMAAALRPGIQDSYWFGNGSNTTEAISEQVAGVSHPHNDWLRLQYEYGTLGMLIFAVTMLAQTIHAWRRARNLSTDFAVFLYAGAAAFLPMAMFMFTDNVILYAAWFGNLQFAMLGIGYAALHSRTPGVRKEASLH